eukprot:TRINITY_DN15717_c0_g1_i4.p1 TRINITY_DN15717_c0_g1~~TRINITY_DN15717_c0_g1_i4.p1  ORF type:complete len:2701 (+),score=424.75 TRINITY_DN15717_c0_g1_i4:78-8105(+)
MKPPHDLAVHARQPLLLVVLAAAAGLLPVGAQEGEQELNSCTSWRAEVLRRQKGERKEDDMVAYDATAIGDVKHKPYLRVEGRKAIVVVGLGAITGLETDPIHPMVNSSNAAVIHWVDTIWIENQLGEILCMRRLAPWEPAPAMLTCSIPAGTTSMTAYQHCNSHGTFKGQTLIIDSVQSDASVLQPKCSLDTCGNWTSDAAVCSTSVAEYWRIFAKEFELTEAKDGDGNLRHKPILDVHGNGSATVFVGPYYETDGVTIWHPMTGSIEPAGVHYIAIIWVLDQSDNIVASREFYPTHPGAPTFTFLVPAGTTKLRSYAYCNKHGLFKGEEKVLSGRDLSGSTQATCDDIYCPSPVVRFASGEDCQSLRAECLRRQEKESGNSAAAFPVPYALGSSNEKHNPYIVLNGFVAKVVVGKGAATGASGDPVHPMVDDSETIHYIEQIWVEDQSGNILAYRQLSPSEPSPATLYFDIPEGTTSVRAYEFCNTHGLFQGNAVDVSSDNIRPGARAGCSVQQCIEGASVSSCQAYTAEFKRRAGTGEAMDDTRGRHKPYLLLDGTMATIVVGIGATPGNSGGYIHPMTASDNKDEVHWVSHVYATDEKDELVAMCELLPTDPSATCSFEVPSGVTQLRPYEFCNKHGFYVGEAVQVSQGNTSATAVRQCSKRDCSEAHYSLTELVNTISLPSSCDFWRTELLRRQVAERGEASSEPYDAQALGNTKHMPYMRLEGKTAIVVVGLGAVTGNDADAIHPMVNSSDANVIHWIDTIWIENQLGDIVCMRRLLADEPAPATLTCRIPKGTMRLTAFQHCNKHGTYKGQTLIIDSVQTDSSEQRKCDLSSCGGWSSDAAVCTSSVTEYWRIYNKEFDKTVATDGNTNLKHKPSMTVHGNGSATVTVGAENTNNGVTTFHPMSASTDTAVVHWINSIWVVDQTDTVIASREFMPDAAGPATFTFTVPAGVTKIRVYEYCNKHGLFSGDEITLSGGDVSGSSQASCNSFACPASTVPYATSADCLSWKAELFRRQVLENGISPIAFPVPYGLGGDNEKHSPYIVLNGAVAKVVVGKGASTGLSDDPVHPMVDDPSAIHYIEHIWVEDQSGNIIAHRQLSPSEPSPATLYFDIPEGTTSVRAYEFCNTHGLWQGEAVAVSSANTRAGARAGCSVQQCIEGASVSSCQAFVSGELKRRAGESGAQNDPTGKHKPYLLLNGTTATIVVGIGATPGNSGGLIHPMTESEDKDVVHWISHIYALDDLGNLVAMCEKLPTDPAPASCTFEVPTGIIFLRPYEFCNKHGLYVGDLVQVGQQGNSKASRQCAKRECTAGQPSLSSAPLSSAAVDALYGAVQDTAERISTSNMCLQHSATFSVRKSLVDASLQAQVDQLVLPGNTVSDTERRVSLFPKLMEKLVALGGRWHALSVVLEHVLQPGSAIQLRSELLFEPDMRFTQKLLKAGSQAIVEGLDEAVSDAQHDLLIIEAAFEMDWGYRYSKALNPHFTMFYSPNFTAETVNVALCGKTTGWMGMGWLNALQEGPLMNHTDVVVTYVTDTGEAVVQDRFAYWIEEPQIDESVKNQRQDDIGNWINGENDYEPYPGALGVNGKEWCPDTKCKPGFSLVQYTRKFTTPDAWDAKLSASSSKIGVIWAFASLDPGSEGLVQHSTKGYVDLEWNIDCRGGTYYDSYNIECKPCDKGTFRPETSSKYSCLMAPFGTFQDETGQDSAKKCPDHFTTLILGAKDEMACVCPGPTLTDQSGRYHEDTCNGGPQRDADGKPLRCAVLGKCSACPEGMICKGGRDIQASKTVEGRRLRLTAAQDQRVTEFCKNVPGQCDSRTYCSANPEDTDCSPAEPELLPGYWSSADAPLSVFRCLSKLMCPGGRPGSDGVCAEGREGTSCGYCQAKYYKADEGKCEPCGGGDLWPLIVAGLLMLVVIFGFYKYSKADISKSSVTMLTATLVVGQMGVMVQTLGVFADLSVSWVEPIKSFISALKLINLDLDVIKVQCYMPTDNILLNLVGQLLVFPTCSIALLSFTLLISKFRGIPFKLDKYLNALGLCALVLYLTLCMACVRPLHCVTQPSGMQTMASNPAVVCWNGTGEHPALAVLGFLGIAVYGVGILAYVVQIIIRYPKLVSDGHGLMLLDRYRFLFQRFSSKAYFWGAYFLVQKLFVALVPIVVPNSAALQILLIVALLLCYLIFCIKLAPWATSLANISDFVANAGLLMFMQTSSFLVDTSGSLSEGVMGGILMTMVTATALLLLTMLGYTLYRRFFPGNLYDAFLCHHKLGAAVLCRWMKGKLLKAGLSKVFLDSDELEGLADIGEIVRKQSKNIVVVASKMVLTRPWCSVEVCSGIRNKISMIIVPCSDFKFYDEKDLEVLTDSWNESDKMIFAGNGISPAIIKECYEQLPSKPIVDFDAFADDFELTAACAQIAHLCLGKKYTKNISRNMTRPKADIIALGAGTSSEGKMTAKVLADMVQERTKVIVECCFSQEDAVHHIETARYMLVVLTAGLLQDESFQRTLVYLETAVVEEPIEIVSAIADQKFEFPGAHTYAELAAKSQVLEMGAKRVINILALPFSAHGSLKVMSAQADELCRRFKGLEKKFSRVSCAVDVVDLKITDGSPSSVKTGLESDEKQETAGVDATGFEAERNASRADSEIEEWKDNVPLKDQVASPLDIVVDNSIHDELV